MRLEQQVVSLELAKKLKELGVGQESVFCWYRRSEYFKWTLHEWDFKTEPGDYFAAFTVAELGEMLPYGHGVNAECDDPQCEHEDDGCLKITKDSYAWFVQYTGFKELLTAEKNLADGMARMLIYLIEKGIINPTEEGR